MEQATQGTGIEVSQTQDNRLKIEIPSDVSFDPGSATIKPSLRPVLDNLASNLAQHPGTRVTIIGHTDASGSDAVNNSSLNRAAAVRDYLSRVASPVRASASMAVARANLSPTMRRHRVGHKTAGSKSHRRAELKPAPVNSKRP